MKINWLFMEMSTDFSDLVNYFEMQISQRQRIAREEARKAFEEFEKSVLDEEERQGVSEESIEDHLIDSLKDTSTKTMLVFLSDRIEYYLRRLCKAIQKETGDQISYNDFVGNPIEKANKYFIHLKKEEIPKEYLMLFTEIQILRNCIVHCNSRIDESKDRKQLEELCSKNSDIKKVGYELLVSEEYVSDKINTVTTIMHKIFKSHGWGTISI
jgi:hypothetical protein